MRRRLLYLIPGVAIRIASVSTYPIAALGMPLLAMEPSEFSVSRRAAVEAEFTESQRKIDRMESLDKRTERFRTACTGRQAALGVRGSAEMPFSRRRTEFTGRPTIPGPAAFSDSTAAAMGSA